MPARHFLIFDHRTAHPMVYLLAAKGPKEAIGVYLHALDPNLELESDGTLRLVNGGRVVYYPHPLAYIEAHHKPHGEWQIRELPAGACHTSLTEAFCGEDVSDIEYHLNACRKLLRRDHPRSRAPGFVWYLRDGVLVTFYRRYRREIEVVQRYVRRRQEGDNYLPWTGDHEELLRDLYLGSGQAARLKD